MSFFIISSNFYEKKCLGFEDILHSSMGGLNSTLDHDVVQERIDLLFDDIDVDLRKKLKKFYERDFILFEYKWDVETNSIY